MVTVVMTISMKTVIRMLTLMVWTLVPRALMEPEIHRVDPEFGSTLKLS